MIIPTKNRKSVGLTGILMLAFCYLILFTVIVSAQGTGNFDEEIFYVDKEKFKLTVEDAQRGYALFHRNYLEIVYPANIPELNERFKKLSIFASPGEYEPITFCVRPFKPLTNVRVGISDLVSAEGNIIGWNNVDIRQVRYEKRSMYYHYHNVMLSPVMLEKVYPHINDYPGHMTQRVWLTVHIPENAKPGLYKATIRFVPDNAPISEIPVEVEVLPIKLLEPDAVFAITTYERYTVDDYRAIYRDMRAHGMNSVKYEQMLGNRIYMEDGKVKIDFDGNGYLEKALDPYLEEGFTKPFLWAMSGEPYNMFDVFTDGGKVIYGDIIDWCIKFGAPGSPEFEKVYRGVINAILDESKKRNWPEIIYQPFNEPEMHVDSLQDNTLLECLKILKSMGLKTELNGMKWPARYDHMLPYLSFGCFHDGPYAERHVYDPETWKKLEQESQKTGMKAMFYNVDNTGIHPEAMRFGYGMGLWYTRPFGVGILQWTYRRQDAWDENPLGYAYIKYPGTHAFSYPESDECSGGPSTGWEGMREGVDDYKYYYTFIETVKRAKESGNPKAVEQAKLAEKDMENFWGKVSFEHFDGWRPRQKKWMEKTRRSSSGRLEVSGTLKVDNGWDSFDDYDICRRLAADWTVKLQDIMK